MRIIFSVSDSRLFEFKIMVKMIVRAALIGAVCVSASLAQSQARYMTEPSLSPHKKEIAFISGGYVWSVSSYRGANHTQKA